MFTSTRPLHRSATTGPGPTVDGEVTLRGRRQRVRRRRLVMRLRDWLGISVIACFSLTLFAVTFFSLVGR